MSAVLTWPTLVMLSAPSANPQASTQPAPRSDCPPATGYICKAIDLDGRKLPCLIFVPPEYTQQRAWPVILFLHGSGERGGDGFIHMDVGIGPALRKQRQQIPAIVVMPQAPADEIWSSEPMLRFALRSLEEASRDYHFDPQRIYLTGISLGGAGVLHLAPLIRGRVAAVVPICAFLERPDVPADPQKLDALAAALAEVPVWVFHGANDQVVPVERARQIVAALKKPGRDVRYTEYPTGDHVIWDRAYAEPELWKWLLAHKLSPRDKP
jgi:predicted peptidase